MTMTMVEASELARPLTTKRDRTFDRMLSRSEKSARRSVAAMKRAAKRMQKNAPELLGIELKLHQCQAMIARLAGFESFEAGLQFLLDQAEKETIPNNAERD